MANLKILQETLKNTMTDKELLEFAAKAAGIAGEIKDHGGQLWMYRRDMQDPWNPLTDDGDRYQLAKQLEINLHFGANYITYVASGVCKVLRWPEDVPNDAYAIVHAAAEIGKELKPVEVSDLVEDNYYKTQAESYYGIVNRKD